MSLVTLPAQPTAPPNVTDLIEVLGNLTVGAGALYYGRSTYTLFRNYGYIVYDPDLSNAGTMWNFNPHPTDMSSVIWSMNFGAIVNTGLMVAETATASAITIGIESSWRGGLQNSGQIFAVAPAGAAIAIVDWASGAIIENSGLIAAQGASANAISRQNGGLVHNLAGGQILAEGDGAVAVGLGRGKFGVTEDPSIINAGLIAAVSTSPNYASVGVYLASLAVESMNVVNSGVISADIAIYVQEYAFSPTQHGNEHITNEASGIINGEIYLGGGDNVITNRGSINGSIILGEGDDLVDSASGGISGLVLLGWGADRFIGGVTSDYVEGDRGNDDLFGGAGADLLVGGRGDDVIDGGVGRDRLYGEFGADRLIVEGGDIAIAGPGDDVVILNDYAFQDVQGNEGFDVLTLPNSSHILNLSAVAASGRVQGFEAIALPGAQTLAIGAGDVASFTGGSTLYVQTTAQGQLALIGGWSNAGLTTVNGQQYHAYTLGAATVLVSGGGAVTFPASMPSGAIGLSPIASGPLAAAPGLSSGIFLTTSITHAQNFSFYTNFTVEADEQWISDDGSGFAPIASGNDIPRPEFTNLGHLKSIGGIDGAVGLVGNFPRIVNAGTISAEAPGDPNLLAGNVSGWATYGLESIIQTAAGSVYGFASGWGADTIINTGVISAQAGYGVAAGMGYWAPTALTNDGDILADSNNFFGVGLYAHNGGSITNTGLIRAEGDLGAYAIGISTGSLRLDNSGDIISVAIAAGAPAVAIDLYYQGGVNVIRNSGLIQGAVAIKSSWTVNGGAIDLINTGQIVGRIELNVNPNGGPDRRDSIINAGSIAGDIRLGGERDVFDGSLGTQSGTVYGQSGLDYLAGGAASDRLDGGDGADILRGGGGADQLTGGAGKDVFFYGSASDSTSGAFDTLTDFQTGVDVIDLSSLAPTSVSFSSGGGFTTLTAQTAGGQVVIRIGGTASAADVRLVSALLGTADADALIAPVGGGTLNGLGGADILIGSAGNDILYGGADDDLLVGGAGNDTYYLDGFDEVRELPGGGIDTLIGSDGLYEMPENFEIWHLVNGTDAYGNSDDNQIFGTSAVNVINGAAGNDIIYGGGSGDQLHGGVGDDSLYGETGDDWLVGDEGNDFLSGGEGDDLLVGGSGNDVFDGGSGVDTVSFEFSGQTAGVVFDLNIAGPQNTGGAGIKTLTNVEGLQGTMWADTLTGDGGANSLNGGEGSDVLFGGGGNDILSGGMGDDIINGGSGDDLMSGFVISQYAFPEDGGNDVFDGGAGNDTVSYATWNRSVIVDLSLTGPQTITPWNVHTLVSVENLIGSNGEDRLTGNSQANSLYGGYGADTLDGGAGNDLLDGGDDFDTATYQSATSAVTVSLALSGAQNTLGAGTDTLVSIENLAGSSFNDVLTGNSTANVLSGGAGNDILDGGGDLDTASYQSATSAVSVSLALSGAQNTFGAGTDTLISIENLTGSGFDDVLTGTGGANVLSGGAGNDTLIGGGGNDVLDGGTGIDTAVYRSAASGVSVSLAIMIPQATGGSGTNTLRGIENLTGSAFNDVLTGDGGSNVLDGGSGADLLVGGLGNDVYVVDNAGDIVTELVGEGRDTVFTSTGVVIGSELRYTLSANVEDLAVSGFAGAINLFGNALANLIVGNGAVNALDGGAGADMLIGGGGNDLYFVDNIADVIIENAGEGRDTVYTSIAYYSLGDNEIEDVVITGSAGCYVVGNALANLMVGGVGADALDGGAGADFMVGGAGNDTYFVDNIGDVLVESAGGGRDTVYVALSYYSLGDNEIEDAVVATSGGAYVIGNGLANLMVGGAGADALDGGAGADFMVGGGGNDSYFVDNLGDTVIESVGEGRDTVYASISYTLGDTEVEDLALLGSGNISAGGNGLANLLVGNGGANVLWGRGGSDTLVGGAGADRFAYMAASEGGDVITDFVSGVDKIQVSAPGFGGGLTAGGAVTLRTGASPTASGTNGQFLYNTSNGQLYWDADGTNGGAAVLLATLSGAPAISASDFVVTDGSSNPLSVGDGGIELMAMSAKDADPAPEILPASTSGDHRDIHGLNPLYPVFLQDGDIAHPARLLERFHGAGDLLKLAAITPQVLPAFALDGEALIETAATGKLADGSPQVMPGGAWQGGGAASGVEILPDTADVADVHLVRGDMGPGGFDPTDFSDLAALGHTPRPEWAVIEM
ncbi:MAG: M10 family metallopeptidase C-terminal domain-containing protein [Hyphomonadaceae bacterium]